MFFFSAAIIFHYVIFLFQEQGSNRIVILALSGCLRNLINILMNLSVFFPPSLNQLILFHAQRPSLDLRIPSVSNKFLALCELLVTLKIHRALINFLQIERTACG